MGKIQIKNNNILIYPSLEHKNYSFEVNTPYRIGSSSCNKIGDIIYFNGEIVSDNGMFTTKWSPAIIIPEEIRPSTTWPMVTHALNYKEVYGASVQSNGEIVVRSYTTQSPTSSTKSFFISGFWKIGE